MRSLTLSRVATDRAGAPALPRSSVLCLALLGVATLAVSASAQVVFRSTADTLVRVGVTVIDRDGAPVEALTADDFEVREDGELQTVRLFALGDNLPDDLPLHVGLLLDTSGSMEADIAFERTAAIKFLRLLPEADDMTVVDFDTEVRLARYEPSQFPRMVERIRGQRASGWTALYDALTVYLHAAFDQPGEKILVLYTDGEDTTSSANFSEIMDLVRASDVAIYAIGLLEHQRASARLEQQRRLQQITDETGGQAFFPVSMEALDEAYARVLDAITGRYILGYVSTNQRHDGTWRRLEVKTTRDDLRNTTLRTRSGYFALYREEEANE